MTIKRIKIENLRNITEADVLFSDGINFVTGKNGSGKSTLLEAIYMLGRGRSFRTTRFGPVVQHGKRSLMLYAVSAMTREHRIGIQKSAHQTQIKIDGEKVTRLSDIAKVTPLQILTPLSHEILERGPEYRRRFLEWGVFHVEPSYYPTYRKFIKALKQRNILLKADPQTVSSWNQIVGTLGEELNTLRVAYFELLEKAFSNELIRLNIPGEVAMTWRRGWEEGLSLSDALEQKQKSDVKQGYTQIGPHRADIRIAYDNRSAFTSISRGQQKMVISALHLAQADVTKQSTGNLPLLLFDDLVAELDRDNRERLLSRLLQLKCQVFISSTDDISKYLDLACSRIQLDNGEIITKPSVA